MLSECLSSGERSRNNPAAVATNLIRKQTSLDLPFWTAEELNSNLCSAMIEIGGWAAPLVARGLLCQGVGFTLATLSSLSSAAAVVTFPKNMASSCGAHLAYTSLEVSPSVGELGFRCSTNALAPGCSMV